MPKGVRSGVCDGARRGRSWGVTIGLAALVATGCGAGSSAEDSTVVVQALWYGEQSDGSIQQGTDQVTITTSQGGTGGQFSVDTSQMQDSGAGAYWNAAAVSGATVAALASSVNPASLNVTFAVRDSIDGPSAGGLMSLAVGTALTAKSFPADVSMTGTIMPDGALGPVGGIPAKISAAASAGLKTVYIPKGQRFAVDPATGSSVDVVGKGQSLGVTVTEVPSVQAAYDAIYGASNPASEPLVDQAVTELLAARAGEILGRIPPLANVRGPAAQGRQELHAGIQSATTVAEWELASGDAVTAFAAASMAERAAITFNAVAETGQPSSPDALDLARAKLMTAAQADQQEAQAALKAAGETPVSKIEQMTALPHALVWAVSALAQIQATMTALQEMNTSDVAAAQATLREASADLARARYDEQVYLPVTIQTVGLIGTRPLGGDNSARMALLGAYTDLLEQASTANLNYYDVAKQSSANGQRELVHFERLAAAAADETSPAAQTPSPEIATYEGLARAMYSFNASSQLVSGLGVISAVSQPDSLSEISVLKQQTMDNLIETANAGVKRQVAVLATYSLDPSFPQWTGQWGAAVTGASPGQVTAQQRYEALGYEWLAAVESKILTAIAKLDASSGPDVP